MFQVQDQEGGKREIKISKTIQDTSQKAAKEAEEKAASERAAKEADEKKKAEVPAPVKPTTAKKPLKISTAIKPAVQKPSESKEGKEESEDSVTHQDRLDEFYKNRAEDPSHYTYTATGDLVTLDKTGQPESTIFIRPFRPLNQEEIMTLMEERKQAIRKTEAPTKAVSNEETKEAAEDVSFVTANNYLREVYSKYKSVPPLATEMEVVNATKLVMEAEQRRSKAMYPQRYVSVFRDPMVKKIILDSKDERKLGYDVYVLGRNEYKREDAYGHYKSQEEIDREALESKMKGGKSYDIILIETYDDPERGFLHPAYTKDFSYTSTQYSSVYQAFEAERLKIIRNDPLVDQIMRTRSARTIHNLASQDKTPIPNSYDLWLSILKAFYQQNTDLGKKLLETGSALFSLRDATVSSPSDYLNALMAVRSILAEKEDSGAPAPIDKRVITEEEQKKARAGAIIHQRKMSGGH